VKRSYTAWCAAILASFALRPFFTKEATATTPNDLVGVFLIAARLHVNI
jgi:hypothetical protein